MIEKTHEEMLNLLEAVGGAGRAELEARVNYAKFAPPGTKIVELGVYRGQGLAALAYGASLDEVMPRKEVVGCDLWGERSSGQGPTYDNPENQKAATLLLEHFEFPVQTSFFRCSTIDLAKDWRHEIGCLVIDADHTLAGVRSDVALWTPHVVVGGFVLLHDAKNTAWPAIDQVVGEFDVMHQWDRLEFVPPFSQWFMRKAMP